MAGGSRGKPLPCISEEAGAPHHPESASAALLDSQPPGRSAAAGHIPALDGLRGIAILLVMLFHYQGFLLYHERIQYAFGVLGQLGWIGVDLFFVLSGFLITRILLATRGKANYFRSFYARRVLRIFPLYYGVTALLFFGPFGFLGADLPTHHDQRWYWLYIANWGPLLERLHPSATVHFWSLGVEEQFYLVWPLLVWALPKPKLLRLTLLLICAAPVVRAVMLADGWQADWVYRNTFARMDTLLLGAAVALTLGEIDFRRIQNIAGAAMFGSVLSLADPKLPLFTGAPMQVLGFSAIAVLLAALLALLLTGRAPKLAQWMSHTALRTIGKYSYGIYVFHLPVRVVAEHLLGPHMRLWSERGLGFAVVALLTAASAGVSFLSFHLLEQPFLKLKKNF